MAAAAEKARKVCYYELLGLDRKCEAAEVKASYRKLALQMHPDKAHQHGLGVDEATRRFQQVQEAYGVLSDAQERAWYDAHREQILRGDDEPGEDPFKTKINLYRYFSTSCFDGFDDGGRGFFAVYAELFEAIDTEEAEWEDADEEHTALPPFGTSASEWADVAAFYRQWLDFCSRKAFGHADKWNPKEAQNRQVRRAMEQENKKARQAAKKDFNAEVRQVVRFVQRRDPRVAARQKDQMKATIDKKQRDLADRERRRAAEAQERQERKDAARRAEEERWAEAAAERAARRARGEVVSEDESSDDSEALEYQCEACRKSFKSEKAYDQHARSKKHLQTVAKLRRELELELEAEARAKEAEAAEEESSDEESVEAPAHEGAPAGPGEGAAPEPSRGGGEEEESGSEGEDDFVARFAASRKPATRGGGRGGGGGPGREARARGAEAAASSSESSEEAAGEDSGDSAGSDADAAGGSGAAGGGGKRAQKRAKQRAILLEKKAEKASVQELVNSCRKAAKAGGKEGDADAAASPTQLPSGQAADTSRCAVCGENFPSRSKLFQHIKASGHAALRPAQEAEGAAAKGRRKRR